MSSTNIERALHHAGVVAVLDTTPEQAQAGDPLWAGEERWKPIMLGAERLRQAANEPSLRLFVGEHLILITSDGKHSVGMVLVIGHPIMKSALRLIRQLLRPTSTTPGAIRP